MSFPVKLYVYDLSGGIARQLSLQLTGRQIDGVWHTSIVIFGKEIFYGQGIIITEPGKSHHGSPLRIIDMGETAIDEDTFDEYLTAMREQYTADKHAQYHLLDFNCNTFTNECLGFLTVGGGIPSYIKSLPNDFLSTSFGAALRPTIDAMFAGRPADRVPPAHTASNAPSSSPTVGTNLLRSVAERVTRDGPSVNGAVSTSPAPAPHVPLTAPMHIITNPASFRSLLSSHRVVVAFFTSATCGPCRMIAPAFEELAKEKSRANGGVGFAKIDLSVGLGNALAGEYQVRVTPTFLFFLDGKKTYELKGVNAPELKTQVDLLIYEAFPPHPHTSLSLRAVEAISLDPILFTQMPNLDTLFTKLNEFIYGVTSWTRIMTQDQVKHALSQTVLPFLKASTATPHQQPKATNFDDWSMLTSSVLANLQLSDLFPLVDIWRLALLNSTFATWVVTKGVQKEPIQHFVDKALQAGEVPRNYLLTVLRMLANTFSNRALGREVILFAREGASKVLIDALLHNDPIVRSAAASLAFNIAGYLQRLRVDKVKARDESESVEENEEWEIEIVTAVLSAVEQETNEETVHRLVACLGLLLRLSPYTEQVTPLLEALGTRAVLKSKLEKRGCGENGVGKKEVRRLISEVADKLCPAAES